MRQAASSRDVEPPVLPPGIRLNTSPTGYRPIADTPATLDRVVSGAFGEKRTWDAAGNRLDRVAFPTQQSGRAVP